MFLLQVCYVSQTKPDINFVIARTRAHVRTPKWWEVVNRYEVSVIEKNLFLCDPAELMYLHPLNLSMWSTRSIKLIKKSVSFQSF